jgi:hypothetical protein
MSTYDQTTKSATRNAEMATKTVEQGYSASVK